MKKKVEETIDFLSTHEVWKDIEGYEGLYQVSSFGNVRSLDRVVPMKNGRCKAIKGRPMKTRDNGHGYIAVTLRKYNVPQMLYIHRLVGNAFLENPHNYPEINHKDEVKSNNNVANLEWCDHVYNNTYGTKLARMVAHTDYKRLIANRNKEGYKKGAISRSKLINVYDKETGLYYGSGFAYQLAPVFGWARTTITGYANGSSQNPVLTMKYDYEDDRKGDKILLTKIPVALKPRLACVPRKENGRGLTADQWRVICYDSLSGRISEFTSVRDASEKTGIPHHRIKNGLNHEANGTKRYVFARGNSNFMTNLQQKYQKMKNKPINVYSAEGEFMFRDFNYNLAEFFHVSTDRINVIARKNGKTADGHMLKRRTLRRLIF